MFQRTRWLVFEIEYQDTVVTSFQFQCCFPETCKLNNFHTQFSHPDSSASTAFSFFAKSLNIVMTLMSFFSWYMNICLYVSKPMFFHKGVSVHVFQSPSQFHPQTFYVIGCNARHDNPIDLESAEPILVTNSFVDESFLTQPIVAAPFVCVYC